MQQVVHVRQESLIRSAWQRLHAQVLELRQAGLPPCGAVPGLAVYGMAKAGLHALTLGLAREYAPKVRVNCIMPGPFLTDISKAWDMEAFEENAKANIPLARGGQAEEVVGAALYFASDASSYTTGAILKIDGGTVFQPA